MNKKLIESKLIVKVILGISLLLALGAAGYFYKQYDDIKKNQIWLFKLNQKL
jgi:hypothetical protein